MLVKPGEAKRAHDKRDPILIPASYVGDMLYEHDRTMSDFERDHPALKDQRHICSWVVLSWLGYR